MKLQLASINVMLATLSAGMGLASYDDDVSIAGLYLELSTGLSFYFVRQEVSASVFKVVKAYRFYKTVFQ